MVKLLALKRLGGGEIDAKAVATTMPEQRKQGEPLPIALEFLPRSVPSVTKLKITRYFRRD